MKYFSFSLIYILLSSFLLASPTFLLNDVLIEVEGGQIRFSNNLIQLEFESSDGSWKSMIFKNLENAIIPDSDAMDIFTDDKKFINEHARFLGHTVSVDKYRNGVVLELLYSLSNGLEITHAFRLFPESALFERTAMVKNTSGKEIKFWGFYFDLPGICINNPEDCVVNIPGPWFPETYTGADKPYKELLNANITFHGAPDSGFGFVALSNPKKQVTMATWMDTRGEVNYNPVVKGNGSRINIGMKNNRQYRLLSGMSVNSDVQLIEFTKGDVTNATSSYRKMLEETMPHGDAPDWVKKSVVLEVYPTYFKNGFKGVTQKLSEYNNIGITCLYLMPHWKGGYSPIDLFEVNPQYGTKEDLQELVKVAHDLGMKVLFDMVIHGMNQKSPLMDQRPELFCKNEKGEISSHPTWNSKTFDWANPEYQQFMVDLVTHDIQTYDIDGYRVDAAAYKGPNWDTSISYPAYRSGSASPELLTKILSSMKALKPDAVLLSEVFGPAFHNVCNFVHDNQTSACQQMIEEIEAGRATAETYKSHLASVFALLPEGTNRVIYTRNHDTSWFYKFKGYTPRFMAFEAINAMCAIPEIFTGDPNHGPNPDDDPATWSYYKKLFSLRASFPELIYGKLNCESVKSSNPMVFSAIKELDGKLCLILISLLDDKTKITLSAENFRSATLSDLDGHIITLNSPTVELQPFQVLVGMLD